MTPNPLYRPAKAAEYLGVSKATLYRYEKEGRLPPRAIVGPGASGWRLSELDKFLDDLPRTGNAMRGDRS